MKIEIPIDRLRTELALIKSIVNSTGKNRIPATQHVLLVTSAKPAAEGVLRMTGTDLDHTLQCDTEAKIIEPGSMAVAASRLFDIAQHLPAGKIATLRTLENNWFEIRCENSQFKVAGISAGEFPEVATVKENAVRTPLNAERLRTFINRTIFATSLEDSRYALGGAQISLNAERDRMVTTDGHRLAKIEGNGMNRQSLSKEVTALVTRKTMSELVRLTQGIKGDIEFAVDDNHTFFKLGSRQLTARRLTGQFPNWEMIIPESFKHSAMVLVGPLHEALKRVELMADDRSKSVSFHFAKNELTLHARSSEEGEAHETVTIENYEGDEIDLNLNVTYITDVLGALSANDVIEFQINDPNSQVGIRPLGETGMTYTTITMPMRA